MCGIFAYFCKYGINDVKKVTSTALEIRHRGPDTTHCIYQPHHNLIFHRLAINGLNPESGQPLSHPEDPNLQLLCNGEIYNFRDLIAEFNITSYKSGSDCEVILHLYKLLGFEETVRRLYGVFAICLLDLNTDEVYLARDPYGVRSMYMLHDDQQLCVASEYKSLYHELPTNSVGHQFPHGHAQCYSLLTYRKILDVQYYNYVHEPLLIQSVDEVCTTLRRLLTSAVQKRLMCDRRTQEGLPAVGAYLSGGFDSSTIAALLQNSYGGRLHTFSIGFEGSPDLAHAKIVADWIGSEHTEVVVTEDLALSAIPEVIYQIESYDTTTVRASTFMYLLSKYIQKNHPDIVVMYSGEGSDEASGSYLYFVQAPSPEEFKEESERLMKELPFFDVLRCDKATAVAGLEVRVPFLDLDFLRYYMSLDPKQKMPSSWKSSYLPNGEKFLLRKSMTADYGLNKEGRQLLPNSIIWRGKEALSDGVSRVERSWSQIISDHASKMTLPQEINPDTGRVYTPEQLWYRLIFRKCYPDSMHLIPHYWLPRWSGNIQDPSARFLQSYGQ